jgi:hypothetical protein
VIKRERGNSGRKERHAHQYHMYNMRTAIDSEFNLHATYGEMIVSELRCVSRRKGCASFLLMLPLLLLLMLMRQASFECLKQTGAADGTTTSITDKRLAGQRRRTSTGFTGELFHMS